MNHKHLKKKVTAILVRNTSARNNDNVLIAKVLKDMYGTTDMEQIAKVETTSITESITRVRRLVQRANPFLGPTKNVSKRRRMKELEIKEEMRGQI